MNLCLNLNLQSVDQLKRRYKSEKKKNFEIFVKNFNLKIKS